MDCAVFDEDFLHALEKSPLSTELPAEARAIVARSIRPTSHLYLQTLSKLAIHPVFAPRVLASYEPLLPELVARWRAFATPEEIAIGFARILPVVPFLVELAEHYLLSDKARLKVSLCQNAKRHGNRSLGNELEQLLALHRLLLFDRGTFLPLVDVSSLYGYLHCPVRAVRYMAIRIICLYLRASDSTRETLLQTYDVGSQSTAVMGQWEGHEVDYGLLLLLENRRIRNLRNRVATPQSPRLSRQSRIIDASQFSPLVRDICGVLMPCLREAPRNIGTTIADTPTIRSNAQSLAHALRGSAPILVTGNAGSGKTTLIRQVAEILGALGTMVSIHLGDQTDAKFLIGTYATSAETPGAFYWQPGILTTAVKEGRWILVEDIDKAPTEVLGVLLHLIERREILLPSKGQVISAARGFRLIATISAPQSTSGLPIRLLGKRVWNPVHIQMPEDSELKYIIDNMFPSLLMVSRSMVTVYRAIVWLYQSPAFSTATKSRLISPRDLFKWCNRVHVSHLPIGPGSGDGCVSVLEGLLDDLCCEALECFTGSLENSKARKRIADCIAEEFQVSPQRLDHLRDRIPSLNNTERNLVVGRAFLGKKDENNIVKRRRVEAIYMRSPFAMTSHALRLMERVGVSLRLAEPVLLVGETGTGKTAIIQKMADMLGFKLTVINLSQQSESSDLLGGYKPVDTRSLAMPLRDTFGTLFQETFSEKKNQRFLTTLEKFWARQQWKCVIKLWTEAIKRAEEALSDKPTKQPQQSKKRKMYPAGLQTRWESFAQQMRDFEKHDLRAPNSFTFTFIEGALIKAVRNGDWVLLDEVNLAAWDTLESVADLLTTGRQRSITLGEKGDVGRVNAHPDFRILACMNPATDVGKQDLPPSIRSRFTEIYVTNPDLDFANLLSIINEYIGHLCVRDDRATVDVARLYVEAKSLAEGHKIVDGANQRPHFSVRTLTRALNYASEIFGLYGLRRSLYEGFCMSFLTPLDQQSSELLLSLINKHILNGQKNTHSLINQIPRRPDDGGQYVQFRHYWVRKGVLESQEQPHYVITPFVERNLLDLVRATTARKFPVLIQGPTSSGKTSMINYLAKRTGHKFVRVNNHEHTDLQEYLGTYVSDDSGKLFFREGVLVEALRHGYWIVLDELNLAPTDVLEALNRLLDDNRELLVPETQEVVRPHKDFMLFATQNPPGLYGGRKNLSRAFRNRFIELYFDDIPEDELETILKERCHIAPSYCEKIVKVYRELSVLRQSSRLFEHKHSFATLRDLFRWANRGAASNQQLAENGYMLLAERVRKDDEKMVVKQVLEKVMKIRVDESRLYALETHLNLEHPLSGNQVAATDIVWTGAMKRLFALVAHATHNREPVLLVGETGCGKTTVCQMLSDSLGQRLVIVNAHQNTETGDIIGSQRPKRNRSTHQKELMDDLVAVFRQLPEVDLTSSHNSTLAELLDIYLKLEAGALQAIPVSIRHRIELNKTRVTGLFEWADGPLVQAMKHGHCFLLDEISLAEDSVLERLNSVLEPERAILLAEKGPTESLIEAAESFQFLATMNPGGDYGKRELSPALRNRFTEIWVPPLSDRADILAIVRFYLGGSFVHYTEAIVEFAYWFSNTYRLPGSTSASISIRDLLAWCKFVKAHPSDNLEFSLLHGAALVYIDGLGANPSAQLSIPRVDLANQKLRCVVKLSELLGHDLRGLYNKPVEVNTVGGVLTVGGFSLGQVAPTAASPTFNLTAPTTAMNAMRVVRALRLRRPILLEGSPGVGKTSLVAAVAEASGSFLTRINLSEQTDLVDLFGSDVPVEGGQSGEFAWRDAPFLRAMQRGDWVLLDEMNLASQSVLEGLNACLDHRNEVFVAELDRLFRCHPNFRVFAAQNPHHQGGGRKGLPASFTNRFTVVYVDPLNFRDLSAISTTLYPNVPHAEVEKMINFVTKLDIEVAQNRYFGSSGAPWEFNLRDTLRWLEVISSANTLPMPKAPVEFLDMIARQRFRTMDDRECVDRLFEEVFGTPPTERQLFCHLTERMLQIGHSVLPRSNPLQTIYYPELGMVRSQLPVLETAMACIEYNMPCILAGASGSGKSSIIRYLASVVGMELEELALSADVDTTDMVGGYEQSDVSRKIIAMLRRLQSIVNQEILEAIRRGNTPTPVINDLMGACQSESSTMGVRELSSLLTQLQTAVRDVEKLAPYISECAALISEVGKSEMARFEWVDSPLIHAIEEGKWVVLDNANLCSPSVLDRLNSLFEIGGHLLVNEHTKPDGSMKTVEPHANFRLFITMDPQYGELSRAMRNRCVEVYVGLDDNKEPYGALEMLEYETHTEANMFALGRVESTMQCSLPIDMQRAISRIAVEHIARGNSKLFERMGAQLGTSGWSGQTLGFGFPSEGFQRLVRFVKHPSVERQIQHYLTYVSSALKRFPVFSVNAQSLVPMRNPYLPSENARDILSLVTFIEAARQITDLQDIEAQALREITRTKLSEISFSESFALSRQFQGETIRTYFSRLIAVLRGALEQWLDSYDRLDARETSHIKQLVVLWKYLLKHTNVAKLDESAFYIYLDLLESWLREAQAYISPSCIATIDSALRPLKTELRLTTGLSMERMWKFLRPSVPCDLKGWSQYWSLQASLEQFDRISVDREFSAVRSSKKALIELVSLLLAREVNVTELPQEITTSLDGLGAQPGSYEDLQLPMPGVGLFELLFDIHSLQTAMSSDATSYDTSLRLAHHARRPMLSALGAYREFRGVKSSFELILQEFWRNGVGEGVQAVISGKVVTELLRAFDMAKESPVGLLASYRASVTELRRHLQQHSLQVVSDQALQLSLLLFAKLKQLLLIHQDLYDAEGFSSLKILWSKSCDTDVPQKELLFAASSALRNTSGYFREIAQDHILPLLNFLVAFWHSNVSGLRYRLLGVAWVHYSVACLKLYVPDRTMDPGLSSIIQRGIYDSRKEELTRELEAEEFFARVYAHGGESYRARTLRQQLRELGDEPLNPLVARPMESQISSLQADFIKLLQTVTIQDLPKLFAPVISDDEGHVRAQARVIQTNLTQIILRFKAYPVYKDIIDPVLGFIYALKLGLELWNAHTCVAAPESLDYYINPLMDAPPVWFLETDVEKHLWSLQKLACSVRIEGLARGNSASRKTINRIFQTLYQYWRVQTEAEKQKLERDSSIYRCRVENEELDKKDFLAMFPDFETEVDIPPVSRHPHYVIATKIARLHAAIYLQATDVAGIDLVTVILIGSSFWKTEVSSGGVHLTSDQMEAALPAVMLLLERTAEWASSRMKDSSVYDFYADKNLEEAYALVQVTQATLRRLNVLVSLWPENITLRDAVEVCTQLLKSPSNTPVAKLITRVEKLHGVLNEWQSVASSEFSIAEQFELVTQLIIKWRKLELSTWPRLLNIEDKRCEDAAFSWWYLLYENLVANPLRSYTASKSFTENLKDLVESLSDFIFISSVGEFRHRLRLTRVFERYLSSLLSEDPRFGEIQRVVANLILRASQYEGVIHELTSQARKNVEKDIADIVLLASWKDTNINALRESAKRSHHKLYKIVRKYRQSLEEPASTCLQDEVPEFESTRAILPPRAKLYSVVIEDLDFVKSLYEKSVKGWGVRPSRLRDLVATLRQMRAVSDTPTSKLDVASTLEEFSTGVVSTVKSLQTETPPVLTEANRKIVSHLKARKRKVFTETLKYLRHMGVRPNPSKQLVGKQTSTAAVLASSTWIEVDSAVFDHMQKYFVRIVDVITRARGPIVSRSSEMEKSEASKCVGFMEHLLHLNMEEREAISLTQQALTRLANLLQNYKILADVQLSQSEIMLQGMSRLTIQNFRAVHRSIRWIPEVLRLVRMLLRPHTVAKALSIEMETWKSKAIALDCQLSDVRIVHANIWTAATVKAYNDSLALLNIIMRKTSETSRLQPNIRYALVPLQKWIQMPASHTRNPDTPPPPNISMRDLDQHLEELTSSIFIALQQLKIAQEAYPESPEDTGWFIQRHNSSLVALRALHIDNICTRLEDSINLVATMETLYPTGSTGIRAVFASYEPIIEQYAGICSSKLYDAAIAHVSLAKTTYLLSKIALTILTKGFCAPDSRVQDSEDATRGAEKGTGLGDGEGAQDISNEIGVDENVSELTQNNNEEPQEGTESEENAIDVGEDELEGEVSDIGERKGSDGEDGEVGDRSDIEDEVGDVEDLDLTMVDDKMWNATSDEEIEKERSETESRRKLGDESETKERGDDKSSIDLIEDGEEGDEGEDIDEDDCGNQQDAGFADQCAPEEMGALDLSEDLQLDGNGKGDDGEDSDFEMEDELDLKDPHLREQEEIQEEPPEETTEAEWQNDNQETQDEEKSRDGVEDEDTTGSPGPTESGEPQNHLGIKNEAKLGDPAEQAPSTTQTAHGFTEDQYFNEEPAMRWDTGVTPQSIQKAQVSSESTSVPGQPQGGDAIPTEDHAVQRTPGEREGWSAQETEFRKLGDALEKWHRNRKEISNAQKDKSDSADDQMDIGDADFEHVPNDEAQTETQALGTATEQEAITLDESMAIDSSDNGHTKGIEEDKIADNSGGQAQEPTKQVKPESTGQEVAPTGPRVNEVEETSRRTANTNGGQTDADHLDESDWHLNNKQSTYQGLENSPPTRPTEEARNLWVCCERETRTLSAGLCEQLRLILEPTQATKMRGDFRTGKRLNIRRVLSYIASDYKKDKIWMRRTKPSKRQYQVMLAVDDSRSMVESTCSDLALKTVALISRALSSLEAGQISVLLFGETACVVHAFEQPFTADSGVAIFERFTFTQHKTDVRTLIERSLDIFGTARIQASSSAELWQLEFIISDGVCEDHEALRHLVRRAYEQQIMIVFVIVDSVREHSILDLNKVQFTDGQVRTERYLDTFPFWYYLVVRDVKELPGVLSEALRSWFAEAADVLA